MDTILQQDIYATISRLEVAYSEGLRPNNWFSLNEIIDQYSNYYSEDEIISNFNVVVKPFKTRIINGRLVYSFHYDVTSLMRIILPEENNFLVNFLGRINKGLVDQDSNSLVFS